MLINSKLVTNMSILVRILLLSKLPTIERKIYLKKDTMQYSINQRRIIKCGFLYKPKLITLQQLY